MPYERDPADDMIAGCLGMLLGMAMLWDSAALQRKQAKFVAKQRQHLQVVFPDTLEVDPTVSFKGAVPGTKAEGDFRRFWIYAVGAAVLGAHALLGGDSGYLLCSGPLALVCGYAAFHYRRKYYGKAPPAGSGVEGFNRSVARVYTVTLPKNTDWQPQTAGRFMVDILQKLGRVTFQIVAEHDRIQWRILDLRRGLEPSVVQQTIQAFYPDADVAVGGLPGDELELPFYRYVMAFEQAQDFVRPILGVDDLTKFDPLVSLTQEMSALGPGERILYTLFVADYARFVYDQIYNILTVRATSAWRPPPCGTLRAADAEGG